MICILGEKMAHKKEKIKIYFFELSCLSCFDNSWLLVRSSRIYSSQNFNIFKIFFLGGGGIYSNQQSRRKNNWYMYWKRKLIEFKLSWANWSCRMLFLFSWSFYPFIRAFFFSKCNVVCIIVQQKANLRMYIVVI